MFRKQFSIKTTNPKKKPDNFVVLFFFLLMLQICGKIHEFCCCDFFWFLIFVLKLFPYWTYKRQSAWNFIKRHPRNKATKWDKKLNLWAASGIKRKKSFIVVMIKKYFPRHKINMWRRSARKSKFRIINFIAIIR